MLLITSSKQTYIKPPVLTVFVVVEAGAEAERPAGPASWSFMYPSSVKSLTFAALLTWSFSWLSFSSEAETSSLTVVVAGLSSLLTWLVSKASWLSELISDES